MAKDSKRKRYLKRVKRNLTLAIRQIGVQQGQLQELVGLAVKQQEELKALKPAPSFTIETLPDPDNYFPPDAVDYAMNTAGLTDSEIAAAREAIRNTEVFPPNAKPLSQIKAENLAAGYGASETTIQKLAEEVFHDGSGANDSSAS